MEIMVVLILASQLLFQAPPASSQNLDSVTVPDDVASIDQAIALVSEGGTVTVKGGEYGEFLRITKPLALKGIGGPLLYEPIVVDSTRDVVIDGFRMVISPPGTETALTIYNSTGVNVEDMAIMDSGVIVAESDEVAFRNCSFLWSPGPGLAVRSSSTGILVENCTFNETYTAVSAFEASEVVLRLNKFSNPESGIAVKLLRASSNSTVYLNDFLGGCECEDQGTGNIWFNSTLRLGNYWDSWAEANTDSGGTVRPKPITGLANSIDEYPLAKPFEETSGEEEGFSAEVLAGALIASSMALVALYMILRRRRPWTSRAS